MRESVKPGRFKKQSFRLRAITNIATINFDKTTDAVSIFTAF